MHQATGKRPRHRIICHAARIDIPADLAIPLGLFVNELVTNAIKYAYADGEGEIRVSARPDASGA